MKKLFISCFKLPPSWIITGILIKQPFVLGAWGAKFASFANSLTPHFRLLMRLLQPFDQADLPNIFRSCPSDTCSMLVWYYPDTSALPQVCRSYAFPIRFPYMPDTVPILSSYSSHTLSIRKPYWFDTGAIRKWYEFWCLSCPKNWKHLPIFFTRFTQLGENKVWGVQGKKGVSRNERKGGKGRNGESLFFLRNFFTRLPQLGGNKVWGV